MAPWHRGAVAPDHLKVCRAIGKQRSARRERAKSGPRGLADVVVSTDVVATRPVFLDSSNKFFEPMFKFFSKPKVEIKHPREPHVCGFESECCQKLGSSDAARRDGPWGRGGTPSTGVKPSGQTT